jgi:hypothetical protein
LFIRGDLRPGWDIPHTASEQATEQQCGNPPGDPSCH